MGWHIGVVEVEVVGVVVVVVVCASWQVPLTQTRLPQHCVSLVQCLPLRLQPGASAPASWMPSDPSVPPRRAAPINLRALPRVRVPSASPLASSSKKPSSLAIDRASSHNDGTPQPAVLRNVAKYEGLQDLAQLPRMPRMRTSENSYSTHFGE